MSGHKNNDDLYIKFFGHCSYPSCHGRKIKPDEPFVEWLGVSFTVNQVAHQLAPLAKLAVVANLDDYAAKTGNLSFSMFLHPKCAAEWGMHLTQDALTVDPTVGRVLTGRK
jgi:hypothetical protein